jgi:hypothetical protein
VGILVNVLHWASWVDYIEYIRLTPHVGSQCGTIPIYSNKRWLIYCLAGTTLQLAFPFL